MCFFFLVSHLAQSLWYQWKGLHMAKITQAHSLRCVQFVPAFSHLKVGLHAMHLICDMTI